jgi:hypothetical protein
MLTMGVVLRRKYFSSHPVARLYLLFSWRSFDDDEGWLEQKSPLIGRCQKSTDLCT